MPSLASSPLVTVEEFDFGVPFERLFEAVSERNGSFLLDSAQSSGGLGAWSFMGFDPFLVFRAKGDTAILARDGAAEVRKGEPLAELQAALGRYRAQPISGLPFSGGAVGCLSYEICNPAERISHTHPDDAAIPDAEFGFYDGLLAFDHGSGRVLIVANPVDRRDAATIVREMRDIVRDALGRRPASGPDPARQRARPTGNFTKGEYFAAVGRIRDYIASGDVYQVNLTQRFEAPLPCRPFELYKRLRRHSPAPFASYLNLGSLQVVGSSPERFLRIRGRRVETRPIKGTRPRGGTSDEDARLSRELLASEKDRAELLMIVDLERNDLGRVCEFGSVRVDELCRAETHPTVHHLVAAVSGLLRPECDAIDCLRAMLPGGSITGAPKVRAMQIIDEVEKCRRHLYTGSAGYLGFDGNCDLNIAIRTMFCRGDRVWYHAGGGIVWDSDPGREYQECLDKARAMNAALTEEEGPLTGSER